MSAYRHAKVMTPLQVWKWARQYNKNPKKFIRWAQIFKAQYNHNIIRYKFGIRVPRTVSEEYEIDRHNGKKIEVRH